MEAGQTYHIYNHAIGKELLFKESENYRFFLQQYEKHLSPIVETFAYCLMPNHFHFLVKIGDGKKLENYPVYKKTFDRTFPKFGTLEKFQSYFISKQFSNLFSSYTQAYNKKYKRKGSLFLKNFKRNSIESDTRWQETFLYILLNPVKHGFVESQEQWKWSSWNKYYSQQSPSEVRISTYREYFEDLEHLNFIIQTKRDLILSTDLE
ncbi:MAG: transposase [Cyclobacteriaceae bacterium]|nr:transposase [Cyclobacteriaceae bacterium]